VRGENFDGHAYAVDAIEAGAVAVVVEQPLDVVAPQIVVGNSRAALAVAASVVHRQPSEKLDVVGVTGTNGKTSVTHMVSAISRSTGVGTGLIGTVGAQIRGKDVALERTTPEAGDLQRLLARMADAGVAIAAVEVSSHALALHRVDAIRFRVATFTNLSQDHLDFHGSMESYYSEKARLFEKGRSDHAVIWIDDPWGRRLASETDVPTTTVGFSDGADVSASAVSVVPAGSTFRMRAGSREAVVQTPISARFNVANALVAAASCLEVGLDFDAVCSGVSVLPQIPGRFEIVAGPGGARAVVDYAHTPEAVSAAIAEARALTSGRVIAVVGAGGDRDRAKRPLMGAAAASADVVVVTSDNPRSEEPEAIIAEVVAGIEDPRALVVEADRRRAIRVALETSDDDDLVLVLGRGHEQDQEFAGGRVEPFDDRLVVAEEWAASSGGPAS
jgi:UDP-N-acetylmuramoyl-L-alanyl-D-glutamate--2,6-diaminopimelate ligase